MEIVLKATLTNDTAQTLNAVLISASLKHQSALEGRMLTDADFKAETGADLIKVTEVPQLGPSLADMQEYILAFGGQVIGAKLCAATSPAQEKSDFIERTYTPAAKEPFGTHIPSNITVGRGENAGKMVHQFVQPFITAANKSLVLPILANQSVCVEVLVSLNAIPHHMIID